MRGQSYSGSMGFPGFAKPIVWIRFSWLIILLVVLFVFSVLGELEHAWAKKAAVAVNIIWTIVYLAIYFYLWRVISEMPEDKKPVVNQRVAPVILLVTLALLTFLPALVLGDRIKTREQFMLYVPAGQVLVVLGTYVFYPYWHMRYKAFVEHWELYDAPEPKFLRYLLTFILVASYCASMTILGMKMRETGLDLKTFMEAHGQDNLLVLSIASVSMFLLFFTTLACLKHQCGVLARFSEYGTRDED